VKKFMEGLISGDLQLLAKLVQQDKSILYTGFYPTNTILKHRPLTFAAKKGDLKVVTFLLDTDIDVDQKNGCDETALHYAALLPNTDVINLLLTNGAYVHLKDSRGLTPLHWSLEAENMENGKILIDNRAKLFANKAEEEKVRNWAIEHKKEEMFKLLLDYQQIRKNMYFNKYSALNGEELQLLKDQNEMKLEKLETRKKFIKEECRNVTYSKNQDLKFITNTREDTIRNYDEIKRKISKLQEEEMERVKEIQESYEFERAVGERAAKKLKDLNNENIIVEDKINQCLHKSKMLHYAGADNVGTSKATSNANKELVLFLQDQIQNLEDVLKCPVCLKVSEVPIYTCSFQHHVCGKCFSSLYQVHDQGTRCPTCRDSMDRPVKHRSMEKMAEQLVKLYEKLRQT